MRKTFLYRAKINNQTKFNCHQWLEICRDIYNSALSQRINIYKKTKKSITKNSQITQLPLIKKDFPIVKVVNAQVLQDVLERLDKTYQSFFRKIKTGGNAGHPRFKNKNSYNSFTLKQRGYNLDGRYLYIKNVGRFKLFLSRPIEGNIKTITIRKMPTGKWFVSFSCDNVMVKQILITNKTIGIDVGIKNFCVDSEGTCVENPKFMFNAKKELRRKQRKLSRRKKGSNRWNKTKTLVAKVHEKITNQRKDFLHKIANKYVNNFQIIYVEDLKIKNMVKNRYLSKSISDSSWGTFFRFLSYKAENAGRKVIKVNPANTSQKCSACGEKIQKSLSVRIHSCPFCNLKMDRDLNAAINIYQDGQSCQVQTSDMLELVA